MSHRHNVLHQCENGYVIQCDSCKNLHIAFGNISFDQTEGNFMSFIQFIEGYCQHYQNIKPSCRSIQIPTPYQGFRFLFTVQELEQLNELLQKAKLVMQAEKLVNGDCQ